MATADKAGVYRKAIRYCLPIFLFGVSMRLFELFEAKPAKKPAVPPVTRNFVAKNAPKSGAGSHTEKKFTRKEKHKQPVMEFAPGGSGDGNDGNNDFEELLFTLAYCWYNDGPQFDSEEAGRKLSLLGWKPEFGDDYVGVVLYAIDGKDSRQYTITDLGGDTAEY